MTLRSLNGGSEAIKGMSLADYIWLDDRGDLHVKKKPIYLISSPDGDFPVLEPWVATLSHRKGPERLLLSPAHYVSDPLRGQDSILLLCETRQEDNSDHSSNTRALLRECLLEEGDGLGVWFGFTQGYSFDASNFLAAERHLCACLDAGLLVHSGQVDDPSGNWNFKIGPRGFPQELDSDEPSALVSADHLVLARYLLEKIARENGFSVTYTNMAITFSTRDLRSPLRLAEDQDARSLAEVFSSHLKGESGLKVKVGLIAKDRILTGAGESYLEIRGLHPMVDPYLIARTVLDALTSVLEN